jgi:hypothetical protein
VIDVDNNNVSVRKWLIQNNYQDVAESIDIVMNGWSQKGTHTRRSWWDVLAGGKKGKPRTIEGITFPVLKAAQLRKGVPVTENAVCRNINEAFPAIRENGRWTNISEGTNK